LRSILHIRQDSIRTIVYIACTLYHATRILLFSNLLLMFLHANKYDTLGKVYVCGENITVTLTCTSPRIIVCGNYMHLVLIGKVSLSYYDYWMPVCTLINAATFLYACYVIHTVNVVT
jgi:hypothetical protein